MKITVSIDSKESIEINHSDLANFINCLNEDDGEQHATFFARLAEHPASDVRYAVADKSVLPIEVIEKLARDPSIEVVRRVANNELALKSFELSLFQEMIDRDVSIASEIADSLYQVREDLTDEIMHLLMKHADPKVADSAQRSSEENW